MHATRIARLTFTAAGTRPSAAATPLPPAGALATSLRLARWPPLLAPAAGIWAASAGSWRTYAINADESKTGSNGGAAGEGESKRNKRAAANGATSKDGAEELPSTAIPDADGVDSLDASSAPSPTADPPTTPPPPQSSSSPSGRFPPRPLNSWPIEGKQVKSSSGVAASKEERAAAHKERTEYGGPEGASLVEEDMPSRADAKSPHRPKSAADPGPAAEFAFSRNLPAETSSSSFASQMLDLASDSPPPRPDGEDQGPTGARSKTGKRSMSSIEKRRQFMGRAFMGLVAAGGMGWLWTMGEPWVDERERRVLGGGEDGTRWGRARMRVADLFDYFNKPAWDPLIPPPLPDPHGRPYTLIIDLDDLLVHSSWSRDHGWRTAKRPGIDYFLGYLSQLYEIVLFTSQAAYTAIPIAEKLDPYGVYAPYKLFKDACRSKGILKPILIKDLNYLGRPLEKVLWLDTKPELYALHPDNGFTIPKWHGERNDTGLVDLIPLLEAIVFNNVKDVRDVVRTYKGKDPVNAYAENEARMKKELIEKWEQEKAKGGGRKFNVGQLFGLSAPREEGPPKLPVEKDRERAQAAYVEEQKHWKEQEPMLKKMLEEDRAKQMAEMNRSLAGMLGAFAGPPKPPDQPSATGSA